jgi:hypothetical protein
MAQKANILEQLQTDQYFKSPSALPLFSGAQPTSVNFKEPAPFLHYLQCLHMQTADSILDSYEKTREHLKICIETAHMLCERFNQHGIRGKDRDFSESYDALSSAMSLFDTNWGLRISHSWSEI